MKKRHWIFITPLLVAAVLLASWLPFRMTVEASEGIISINISQYHQVPAEIVSARTQHSKTTFLGYAEDGRAEYALDSSINSKHYLDPAGAWQDIDTTINPDGSLEKVPYRLSVYMSGMPGFRITDKKGQAFDIWMSLRGITLEPNFTKPVIKDNMAFWPDLFPDVDVILTASTDGVNLSRILKSDKALTEYEITIQESSIKGELQLMPLRPAVDATGQLIEMVETLVDDGRKEALTSNIIDDSGNAKVGSIVYPVYDAVDVQVGAGADDVMVKSGTAEFSSNTAYHGAGHRNASDALFLGSAQRHASVAVPQGATIDTAYLIFVSRQTLSTTTVYTYIDAEAADDPVSITSRADWESRARTTAKVAWDSIGTWSSGGTYNSPEIKTVIQEIVNRDGWESGNAMQVFWSDYEDRRSSADARRDARSYDYNAGSAPKLHIEYTEAGGEPDISVLPTSKAFGILKQNATHWSSGSTPSWPLDAGDCYFEVTNNGTMAVDLTANVTDPTGGIGATCVDGSPGANEVRVSLFAEGDGSTDNTTIVDGTPRSFYSDLAASANISWEVKLEIGTSTETPPTSKTFIIKIIASTS